MRSLSPRPVLLVLTLDLVVGAIAFVELRLDATGSLSAGAGQEPDPPGAKEPTKAEQATAEQKKVEPTTVEKTVDATANKQGEKAPPQPAREKQDQDSQEQAGRVKKEEPAPSDAERIAKKEEEHQRAQEISNPSGFVNTDGFSVKEAAGEKVVLLEFWTYTCFNCQNVQPHINAWHDEYADEGLQVVGVHTPEFGFEKEYANVEAAVREAGIEYPVVLDNAYATWNAYDNRYWPAMYLIDADGFVRYKHFGEGAYGETEKKIQELLAERDRISG